MMFGAPNPGPQVQERFKEVLGWVNDFIKPTGFVAETQHLTLADIAFIATYRCYPFFLFWQPTSLKMHHFF